MCEVGFRLCVLWGGRVDKIFKLIFKKKLEKSRFAMGFKKRNKRDGENVRIQQNVSIQVLKKIKNPSESRENFNF